MNTMQNQQNPEEKNKKKRKNPFSFIEKAPVISFFIVLILILALIVGGQFLKKPPEQAKETKEQPKHVRIFSIGRAPKVRTQAEIEKSGVIRMVAQASGVVQKVNVQEGQEVWRGSNIAWISTNYQGGTVESVQRQEAAVSYQHSKDTMDKEKELINLRREEAHKVYENTVELKKIQNESESETRDVIDINNDILDTINTDIEELEVQTTLTEQQEQTLLSLKQQKSQFMSTNNQLKQSLRQTEYQTKGIEDEDSDTTDENNDEDSAAVRLDEIQRDKTLKQLDLEEKSKELALEISRLDLTIAQIREALMYPASPANGVVERVFVKQGQVVNPGDMLAMVTAHDNTATAIALVSTDVARRVSFAEPSSIGYNGQVTTLLPSYVSKEPTDGTLHSIIYNIPDGLAMNFSHGSFVDVEIPVGNADTISTQPFIPVDAVYQTQDGAYVYIVSEPKEKDIQAKIAKTREVGLGTVYGSFVEVKSGLQTADQVILDRTVVENDKITTQEDSLMEDVNTMPETGG